MHGGCKHDVTAGGTHVIKVRYVTAAERVSIREKHLVPPLYKPTILKMKTSKSAGMDFEDDVTVGRPPGPTTYCNVNAYVNAYVEGLESQNASLNHMLGSIAVAAARPKGMAKPSTRPKGVAKPSSKS